jgi:ribose transport system ATP-binding protein
LAQNLTSNDIVKHFAGVTALSSGCLTANSGEVVALIGANGSGKSTLCKIITGVVAPDEGQLLLNGSPISFSNPVEAIKSGIAAVYQDLSLIPSLSIAQNIWLTREPMSGIFIKYRTQREHTQKLLNLFADTVRTSFKPDTLVNELPPDEQQIVEILKAVSTNPRIMILDEATSSLDNRQVDRLFTLIGEWKKQDIAIIFISHRMAEVFRIADRITVLRNGKTIGDFDAKKVKEKDLINMMVENAIEHLEKTGKSISKKLRKTVLKVTKLRTQRLQGIDFEVKQGELLGIAGLQGQGQSDILHSIFGSIQFSGTMILDGREYQFKHTSQSMAKDIALVPGDRAKEGLLMRLSILENLMLPSWMKYGFPLATDKAKKEAAKTSTSLKIIMADLNMPVSSLSGGNAQKVVIGKWLQRTPRILLLNDPTKGVDVGTKAEFYDLLKELCKAGTSILFYSSDDEELVGLCDRVLVIRDGKIRKELTKSKLTLSSLVIAMVTSGEEPAHATD